jgi:hypothetical protein
VKTRAITSGRDHRKTTWEIDTAAKGEDLATMTTTVPIVKYPRDIKTITIKEMTAGTLDTAAMAEKTPATTKGSNEGDLENTTRRQMIC